jgi:predicted signal transduction protein with EAL and GGDEF domain
MAHSLGMAIIAEGVETQDQADFLSREGAECAQGWLFGKPMPITDLAQRIREQQIQKRRVPDQGPGAIVAAGEPAAKAARGRSTLH